MARVLIIGGTGTISAHTVAFCLVAGHEVVTFNRGLRDGRTAEERYRRIDGNRGDRTALADAIASARPDVLIDFACFEPADAEALADLASGRVGHLVFVSTVDVFGFPLEALPVPEDAPLNPPVGAYAEKKRRCEELLRERAGPDLPLTIARPTFSMGARFVIAFFDGSSAVMMNRIRNGLPIVVPGDGRGLIHPSASRDTGAMIARLAGEPASIGRTWTCGTDRAFMPVDDYVRMIAGVLGREPELVHIPKELIATAHLPAIAAGIYHNVTRFDLAFAFDRFKADFPDFRWQADLTAPIGDYVRRLEHEGAFRDPPAPGIDDILIGAWEKANAAFGGLRP